MRKKIEIAGKIRINDLSMPSIDQLKDASYCVQCAAAAPISVLLWRQIRLENRIEDQNRRHHHRAIADDRYT